MQNQWKYVFVYSTIHFIVLPPKGECNNNITQVMRYKQSYRTSQIPKPTRRKKHIRVERERERESRERENNRMEYGVIYHKFLVKVFSKSCQINLIKNLNFSYKTFFIVYALNMPDQFSQLRLRSISKPYLSFFCTHLTRWDFKHTFSTHYYWPLNGHEFLKPAIFLNIFIFSFFFF